MFRYFLPVLCILLAPAAFSQYHTDKKLQLQLKALTDSFHGVAGVYVLNLRTRHEA